MRKRRTEEVFRWEDLVHVYDDTDRSMTYCGLPIGAVSLRDSGTHPGLLLAAGAEITCETCATAPHAASYTFHPVAAAVVEQTLKRLESDLRELKANHATLISARQLQRRMELRELAKTIGRGGSRLQGGKINGRE